MKKIVLILLSGFFGLTTFAQGGDVTIGAQGGYTTKFKGTVYGLNLSYGVNNMLEISASEMMSTDLMKYDLLYKKDYRLKLFSATHLNIRFLLLNFGDFATGPGVGAQYLIYRYQPVPNEYLDRDFNGLGFNIGWHARCNVTENLRINAGWHYSSIKEENSYNTFYLGIGYAFNLY
ncbi:MAG: hypothetical protein EZS26_002789 [Candidatus Ordinivivax streblomastigis]|uniref:Outer membrane protein beta-barrel domain-containing protein n=1 Tax=Candidatus Ordinivivax streblomastigis TaxID=2540710 RepID=A0A5M8NWI7_9BACT|nr:MAG: hypothetical protein EZS26_002789 [Candidatus Ordinivivax streblomastigis]